MPLIENVLKPLAKSVLITLELAAEALTTDAAMHKKIFGSGFKTLRISNEEINDTIKIPNYLEDSGLLIKDVTEKN